jgi:branched-chain amino acid transport system substrate-binding protein
MNRTLTSRSRSRKTVTLALVALATALMAAACGGSEEPGGQGKSSTYIIGAAIAQSGSLVFYDKPLLDAMNYKVDEINAAGGINGHKVKIIVSDNKSDISREAASTQELIQKGAKVIVTTSDYNIAAAAALIANKKDTLVLTGNNATSKGLGPLGFNTFQAAPAQIAAFISIMRNLHATKPFVVTDTSVEGTKSLCNTFISSWKEAGNSLAGEASFSQEDASMASQANAVRRSAADAVIMCSYPPGGGNLVRQLRSTGANLPIIANADFDGTFWLKSVPTLSDFYFPSMTASQGDDPNPKVNEFLKAVKPASGASYALWGYTAVDMATKAMQQTNSTSGKVLAKAIEGWKDEDLLVGKTTYTADCHTPIDRAMVLQQVKNGKISFVGPLSIKPSDVPRAAC